MSDTFMKDVIECSDDENYGFKYNQVIRKQSKLSDLKEKKGY